MPESQLQSPLGQFALSTRRALSREEEGFWDSWVSPPLRPWETLEIPCMGNPCWLVLLCARHKYPHRQLVGKHLGKKGRNQRHLPVWEMLEWHHCPMWLIGNKEWLKGQETGFELDVYHLR